MVAHRLRWLALVVALHLLTWSPARGDAAGEYEIKAAFLYNFTKYVEWPPAAFDQGDQLFVCILGDDPFGRSLDEIVGSKMVQQHSLTLRRIGNPDNLRPCHVLFIPADEDWRMPAVLNTAEQQHILTVGESDDFVANGGVIGFLMEGNKVRFAINTEAAQRSGLQISSQLLKLATRVVPGQIMTQ